MDLTSFGTGGLVLSKISSMVNLLTGRSQMPSGCGQGGCGNQGAGYVDPAYNSLTRHLTLANSGPSDFPLLITYKNDTAGPSDFGTEFGAHWFTNYHRALYAASPPSATTVAAPPNNLQYSSNADPIYPLPPNTNALTGSPAGGWTETQRDGNAFVYDSNGVLRAMKNPAGVRWTLSWDVGFNRVLHLDGPYSRRMTMSYDGNNMIRRIEDPGGRITTFVVNGNKDLVRFITPELCVTSMVYDNSHGLLAWINPDGTRTSYAYHTNTYPVPSSTVVQLPMGQRTTYTVLQASGGSTTATIRTPSGAVTTVTIPGTFTGVSTKINATTDPFGNTTHYYWDQTTSQGLIGVKDPRGVRTSFAYAGVSAGGQTAGPYQLAAVIRFPDGVTPTRYSFTYDSNQRLESVIDELGDISTLVWDDNGQRTAVIDPYGVRTSYVYDSYGRMVAVVDGLGNRASQVYDGQGRVVADIDALGNRTTYGYDANSQLLRVTDPLGNIATTLRDQMNRLLVAIDPLGNRTSYAYDAACRLERTVNPIGAITTWLYDSNGRVVATIDPLGNRTSYGYDASGNQVRVENPLGAIWTAVYDVAGRKAAEVDPLGNRTSYGYDLSWNQNRVVDPLGYTATNVFDLANRFSATVNALAKRTTYTYDSTGTLLRSTDPLGRSITYLSDSLLRQLATVDAVGNRASYSYDKAGRLSRIESAIGAITTILHDRCGHLVATVDPLNRRTTLGYDSAGRRIRSIDSSYRITTAVFDRRNMVSAIIDAAAARMTQLYDATGLRVAFIDAQGYRTTFAYDKMARCVSSTDPLSRRATFVFDPSGNALLAIDGRGYRTTSVYDALGRLRSRHYGDGTSATFTFNRASQRVSTSDTTGLTTTCYDAAGRASAVIHPSAKRVSYGYDAADQRSFMSIPDGARFSYSYGVNGLLTYMRGTDGTTTSWSYDSVGRPTSIALPNGTQTSITYDLASQLKSIAHSYPDGAIITKLRYVYNNSGFKSRMSDERSNITSWVYDSCDRLTSEYRTGAYGYRNTFTYTVNGNRLRVATLSGLFSATYDAANQLTARYAVGDTTTFLYDGSANRLFSKSSANGTTTYGWDGMGLLKRVESPNATASYTYNADGQRTRTEDSLGTVDAIWDGDNVLQRSSTAQSHSYVYALTPGRFGSLVSQSDQGVNYYYHHDGNGNVVCITDANAVVVNSFVYDGFGGSVYGTQPAITGFRYVGELQYHAEPSNGLYYGRARYYDPACGRFLSRDPLSATSVGRIAVPVESFAEYVDRYIGALEWRRRSIASRMELRESAMNYALKSQLFTADFLPQNEFVYALNNPVNHVDPSGMDCGMEWNCCAGASYVQYGWCLKFPPPPPPRKPLLPWLPKPPVLSPASRCLLQLTGDLAQCRLQYNDCIDKREPRLPFGCFVAGTLVWTEQGLRAIEEVRPGDRVVAWNEGLRTFELETVSGRSCTERDDLVYVWGDDWQFECSPNHMVLSLTSRWTPAAELVPGDVLRARTDQSVVVQGLHKVARHRNAPVTVYNLHLEGLHNYCITGLGVVVHNLKPP